VRTTAQRQASRRAIGVRDRGNRQQQLSQTQRPAFFLRKSININITNPV
jgi:hypothetical protein